MVSHVIYPPKPWEAGVAPMRDHQATVSLCAIPIR